MMLRRTLVVLLLVLTLFPGAGVANAGDDAWRTEFDALCGQSENSMNMTVAELKGALGRCDTLKEQIEKLEATPRKVYLRRLQMCRNLLEYMLDSRLKGEQK